MSNPFDPPGRFATDVFAYGAPSAPWDLQPMPVPVVPVSVPPMTPDDVQRARELSEMIRQGSGPTRAEFAGAMESIRAALREVEVKLPEPRTGRRLMGHVVRLRGTSGTTWITDSSIGGPLTTNSDPRFRVIFGRRADAERVCARLITRDARWRVIPVYTKGPKP